MALAQTMNKDLKDLDNSKECNHERIDFNTCACLICGNIIDKDYVSEMAQINDYDEMKYVRSKTVRKTELYPDKLDLPYDKEIIERASKISASLSITKNRINKLRMRRFACLYHALRELERSFDVYELADAVQLDHADISPAITMFSSITSGYRPPRNVIQNTAVHPAIGYANSKMKKLGFDEKSKREVQRMIQIALEDDNPKLSRRRAKTITIGAIHAFIEITGFELTPELKINIKKISGPTITQTKDEILEATNKFEIKASKS